jgi:hypothetical protein
MTYEAGVTSEIIPGAEVCTRDDEFLGHVKEVSGTKFLIDGKDKFWLGQDFVGKMTESRVTIILPADRVDEYKEKK